MREPRSSFGVGRWILAIVALGLAGGFFYLKRHPELAKSWGIPGFQTADEKVEAKGDNHSCALSWERVNDSTIRLDLSCEVLKLAELRQLTAVVMKTTQLSKKQLKKAQSKARPIDRKRENFEVLHSLSLQDVEPLLLDPSKPLVLSREIEAPTGGVYDLELQVKGRFTWPEEQLSDLGAEAERIRADEAKYPQKYFLSLAKDVY